MMRAPTLVLALAASAAPAGAAELLSLEQAVGRALERSPAVAAVASRVAAAEAEAERARGRRLPTVDLSATYHGTDSPAEVFALLLNQERFDMDAFFASDPNSPDWLDTFITSLEVRQPVYTGGELSARIRQAETMADAAGRSLGHERRRIAFETATAFLDLVTARERVGVLEQARATTAGHVVLARSFAEQGMLLRAEVLQAEVHLAEMDEMVARARNGARLAEAALNLEMGEPLERHWRLADRPSPSPPAGGLAELVARALTEREDLSGARLQVEAGRLEERVARSEFLPEVALVGRYDLYDDTVFGAHGESGAVMAVARLNLFNGGSDDAALEAARHRTAAHAHDLRRFEDGIRLQVEQAYYDLETARVRLATAGEAVAAARETLRVREHRFRQGLDRMIDLQDADTALREAELRQVTARADAARAALRLRFATGAPVAEESAP